MNRGHDSKRDDFIVPVLDLKGRVVVRAHHGLGRGGYRAVRVRGVAPYVREVVAFFVRRGFRCFYLADLEALEGRTSSRRADYILHVVRSFRECVFWFDGGFQRRTDLMRYRHATRLCPIVGSESLAGAGELLLMRRLLGHRLILSLDYAGRRLCGKVRLLDKNRSLWTKRVIVMNLSRIGSHRGADMSLLAGVRRKSKNHDFIQAGGVRRKQEEEQLRHAHIHAILQASALYEPHSI